MRYFTVSRAGRVGVLEAEDGRETWAVADCPDPPAVYRDAAAPGACVERIYDRRRIVLLDERFSFFVERGIAMRTAVRALLDPAKHGGCEL